MQLRVCPNDLFPLARICRQAQQRGEEEGSGDSIRRGSWVMGPLFRLAILGLVHRFEADMAIVS